MASPAGTAAYLQQLQALMPRGRAWTRDADATLTALLRAFAAGMAALDLKALQARIDILPSRTTDLIDEWERTVGLPDACSEEAATGIAARRAAVVERLVARPDLNPRTFVDLARSFGLTVTVDEQDQARAGMIDGLDVSGDRWRHVWWITVTADESRFKSVLDDVSTPLLTFDVGDEFLCRLRRLNPAHAHLELSVSLAT